MFHKFVDFYMVIISQILRAYAYIQILLENYPTLVSYFHSYFSLSYFAHSNRQLLWFREVWVVYAGDLGLILGLPIFHQHYLTGMDALPLQFCLLRVFTETGVSALPLRYKVENFRQWKTSTKSLPFPHVLAPLTAETQGMYWKPDTIFYHFQVPWDKQFPLSWLAVSCHF